MDFGFDYLLCFYLVWPKTEKSILNETGRARLKKNDTLRSFLSKILLSSGKNSGGEVELRNQIFNFYPRKARNFAVSRRFMFFFLFALIHKES